MSVYRSPHPAFEIPDMPLADFVLARAARTRRPPRARRRRHRTHDHLRATARPGRSRSGRAVARRVAQRGRLRDLQPEHAGVPHRRARDRAARRDRHHREPDVHARRPGQAAAGLARADPLHLAGGARHRARRGRRRGRPSDMFSFGAMDGATPFDDLLAQPGTPPAVAIDPTDVVALPYSSGTTGLPKGVMLTHRNLVANILQVDASGHLRDGEDTLVCFLPFFHIYGLVVRDAARPLVGRDAGRDAAVRAGAVPGSRRALPRHGAPRRPADRARAGEESGRERPRLLARCASCSPAPRRSAPTSSRQCTARVGCVLQQGYGMTETSPATHTTSDDPASDQAGIDRRAGREHGMPRRGSGDAVRMSGPDSDGEIWLRGPQVMLGYFNRPEETRATLDARRLAAHRRHRPRRRGRPLLHRRSAEGADQIQGDADRAGGARGRAAVASGGRRCRGRAAAGRGGRRDPARIRGVEGAGDGRRADGVRRGAGRALQEDPPAGFIDAIPKSVWEDSAACSPGRATAVIPDPCARVTKQARETFLEGGEPHPIVECQDLCAPFRNRPSFLLPSPVTGQ